MADAYPSRSVRTPGETTVYTSATSSRPSYAFPATTASTRRMETAGGRSTARPSTARPRTGHSTLGVPDHIIICALTESRGISPTVGLAFINLDTGEAALSQISDSQTYVRTVNKLRVYAPSQIIIPNTATAPPSKLFSIIEEYQDEIGADLVPVDRRFYVEADGLDLIHQLAFAEDVEAIKISIGGNYFAVCCFSAALKFIELSMGKVFQFHSLRVKYEPSEGTMMIDVSTIRSLELIQNLTENKSRDCLYGLLNHTLTLMGSRLLRSNILQPSTNVETISKRNEAVEELMTNEQMFSALRGVLKGFLDAERILTSLIVLEVKAPMAIVEDSINKVIALKQFLTSTRTVWEALEGCRSELLLGILTNCGSPLLDELLGIIGMTINEDASFSRKPLELRNQRTYAVKSGVNGLLDVARTAYKELTEDAYRMVDDLREAHGLSFELRFDSARHFYIRLPANELEDKDLPEPFSYTVRNKRFVECNLLDLMKLNQKLVVCHEEILAMSDKMVNDLIGNIRTRMSILFKACESIAILDMFVAFAAVAISNKYVRPQFTETLGVEAGRHPILETFHGQKYVPNDICATQQKRFQIITGANMSGKSTYIRSIALMTVMAQIGSFVPANYASFPIMHQLFARLNLDDSIEANMSTFAAEMSETAFILRNIDRRSIAIIDELGRGTSTRDGLAIAIAIAEALIESHALVWFVTHFRELATILEERPGVLNLHLSVAADVSSGHKPVTLHALYKIVEGAAQERHYGLALARSASFPPGVLEIAEEVAAKLAERNRRRRVPQTMARERKRKLILNLKQHLVQTRNGILDGEALEEWLKELQREFVMRMTAIDAEVEQAQKEMSQVGDELSQMRSLMDEDADGIYAR